MRFILIDSAPNQYELNSLEAHYIYALGTGPDTNNGLNRYNSICCKTQIHMLQESGGTAP